MGFTIYRTTKGRVGEPVYAETQRSRTPTSGLTLKPRIADIFPIREYYTNKQLIPASYLDRLARRA